MPHDITLLPEEELRAEKFAELKIKLQSISIIALVVTILLVTGIFIFWSILTNQISQISRQIQSQEQIIADFRTVESLQQALKIKLTSLAKILSSQPAHGKVLANLKSLMPGAVSLADLSLEQNGKVSLSGSALNSSEFAGFISALTDKDRGGKFFSDIIISSITGSKDGTYKFSISMMLKK